MLRTVSLFAVCATVLVALPLAAGASNNTDTTSPNWAEHVAPMLYENCVTCHRPGQVAPMSLLTYKEARPWAKSIRNVVTNKTMPPWFADPAHGTFSEDPRLSDAEIALVSNWVAAGAPAGDLSKAPEAPTFTTAWQIGEPDVVLTMAPFQITDDMEDHYEWVRVENPLDRDMWIKELEVRPTFKEGAHHNLTYITPADFTVEDIEGAGRMQMDYVSGWAPGVMPTVYPEGYGKLLPADSAIWFQMHYHKDPGPGTGGIDETSVGVNFYEGEPENKLTTLWVVDPVLQIPPNEADYQSMSEHTFPHDAILFDFTPHMHLRGKSMKFTITYPDGREEVALNVPNYDFNWQLTYSPIEPLILPAGTTVRVDAVFDNSAENPANPDPSITVTWGEETTDEMMIGFMNYSMVDKAHQDDMENYAVPPQLREQMKRMREWREQQRAQAEQEKGGDE